MSNWNKYHELWQQKRNELQIDADAQTDWSEMHNLLDEHMPLNNAIGNGLDTGTQWARLAKLRLLYLIGGLIVVGLISYVMIYRNGNTPIDKNHKPYKTETRKKSTLVDSALQTNSSENHNKSADNSGLQPAGNSDVNADRSTSNGASKTVDGKNSSVASAADLDNNHSTSSAKNVANTSKGSNSGLNNSPGNRNHVLLSKTGLGNHTRLGDYHSGSNYRSGKNDGSRQNDFISSQQPGISNNLSNTESQTTESSSRVLEHNTIPLMALGDIVVNNSNQPKVLTNRLQSVRKISTDKNIKAPKNAGGSKFDWGLLLGVNSKGGFTPKAQNHNFYGNFSVDIYMGLFTNYNLNDKWAIGVQGRFLTPHTSGGSYNYTHSIEVEGFNTIQTFQINNSRKVYTIDIPVHLIYKATPNINIKAGPLLSLPIKDINRISFTEQTYADSAQYVNDVKSTLKSVNYQNKLNYGVSAGVGFNYKFLWLDATYSFYPQQQKVSSTLGTFTSNANNLQITIGIKLNKSKK